MLNWVDGSNFTGPLSPEQVKCLLSKGIRGWSAGAGRPRIENTYTVQQIEAWLSGGGEYFDFFRYLYLAGDTNNGVFEDTYHQVYNTLDLMKDYKSRMRQFWGDAEDVDPSNLKLTVDQRVVALQAARLAMLDAGTRPGWYTGGWWWRDSVRGVANRVLFPSDPLWDAFYPTEPAVYPFAGREYGGWTKFSRIQFQGSVPVCGLNLDLDWDSEIGDALTPQDKDEIKKMVSDALRDFEDNRFSLIFRICEADYWNPGRPGGYQNPDHSPRQPDPEVIAGIKSALGLMATDNGSSQQPLLDVATILENAAKAARFAANTRTNNAKDATQ